ncbi:hypothetical protein [Spirillospora albida]|uniref:hypothetical protein n=1 Tax=Spirillospora albida TaxID=58123 RepID=UPI0004BE8D06|nr:hypothetical protein [Spirillospora albida]
MTGTRGPVPLWADRAAQATLWCVLPSGIWRILFGLGFPVSGLDGMREPWLLPYVILLSVLAEGAAFLGMGLVRGWGEVWPRWIPVLRGRTIHPLAAIIPASLGAAALVWLWTPLIHGFPSDPDNPAVIDDGALTVITVCYLPLLAWGPLLAAVTVAYAVRRRRYG